MDRGREDVENLFIQDRCPFGTDRPIYDTTDGGRLASDMQFAFSVAAELRAQIVRRIILSTKNHLDPFTVVRAHELMANHDVKLDALLVQTDFVPLLAKARNPWLGHKLKIFSHPEVPRGDIYGVAEAKFVGVVSRSSSGCLGVLVFNPNGLISGRFQLRSRP